MHTYTFLFMNTLTRIIECKEVKANDNSDLVKKICDLEKNCLVISILQKN